MKKEAKVWFDLAENDFQDGLLLWKGRRYSGAVFFFQQAVEKILKAYIVDKKNKVPLKTHRIELLITEAGLNTKEIENPKVEELSKAYIRVRYPDLNRQYYTSYEKVEPLIVIAKKVYLWIKNKLISQ
jgi:HEPN domain-containing protein